MPTPTPFSITGFVLLMFLSSTCEFGGGAAGRWRERRGGGGSGEYRRVVRGGEGVWVFSSGIGVDCHALLWGGKGRGDREEGEERSRGPESEREREGTMGER